MTKKAKRFNSNKIEFDDIPLIGIVEVAKVAAYGANKYNKNNWRKEASTTQYLNCTLRHVIKYLYGENIDSESKCSHLGHAAWNLLALLEKIKMKKDIDDRFVYDSDVNIEDLFITHNGLTEDDLNDMAEEMSKEPTWEEFDIKKLEEGIDQLQEDDLEYLENIRKTI